MTDETDEIPGTPRGARDQSLPSMLNPNVTHIKEFNPMLELFSQGEGMHGIDTRTDVTDLEALQFSRGRFLANYFEIPELTEWIDSILRLKISRLRKSRQEAVEAVKAMHGRPEEGVVSGLLDRLRR